MNTDWNTASTSPEPPSSPKSSVKAWSPQQFTWLSNAAPTTSTQSNPTEQFQDFGQMAIWGDASVSETCMGADLFPPMQSSSSYMNPQEAVGPDGRSGAMFEQEGNLGPGNGNSIDTWSPLQSNESNEVTPTNLNQYNPMEQPQNYGQTASWSVDSASPASNLVDNPFPRMELQSGHVNLQGGSPFEARDAATASAPPQFSVDTGYSQQFTWPSNATPPTSYQYNPTMQLQDLGQTPTWSVDSPPAAPDMVNTPLPRLQPSGSHMNPQEVVPSLPTCATASAPPCSSVDTGYSQQLTWPSNASPPTSTQYNPMEQIQDYGQTATWSDDSVAVAPHVDADLLSGTQHFNSYMFPQEIRHSEARCAVGVEQKGCLGPGNGKRNKRQHYDERTVSILIKHYFENRYPSNATKEDLANQTGLTIKQVGAWFAVRRKRHLDTVKNAAENGIHEKWSHNNEGTLFTLERHYIENPLASTAEKKDLAKQTGLTSAQIKIWFENRQKRDLAAGVEIKNRRHCINPFNEQTHQLLKRHYLEDQYPNTEKRKTLADKTGLPPKQIGNWFSNCRRDERYAAEKKITTDAANCHIMDSTSTEDSENVDPMKQPMYACQTSTPKTLTNGNLLSLPTASSTPNPSMPMFNNPSMMMTSEGFHLPMQQLPPQMAMNPTFQQTAALQNPAQSQNTNFYYQR